MIKARYIVISFSAKILFFLIIKNLYLIFSSSIHKKREDFPTKNTEIFSIRQDLTQIIRFLSHLKKKKNTFAC